MEYDELVYACTINRIFNYACERGRELATKFLYPSEIFTLGRKDLVHHLGGECRFVDDILNCTCFKQAERDVAWANENGVRVYYVGDADYPRRLKECNDAPIVIFFKGCCNLNSSKVLSIVGTRHSTVYGEQMCKEIVRELSTLEEPPLIVSGLAYGIDIAAHKAAMEYSLPTVGVMATGLDTIYPSSHRRAAMEIMENGGILTEFAVKTPPLAINFIRRNRIIAGLSDATLLVESRREGGGMVTSKMAYSYNRDVFAVPGRVVDKASEGCNILIRDNIAEMVSGASSIWRSMRWKNLSKNGDTSSKIIIFESDNDIKRKIIKLLSEHMLMTIDELVVRSGGYRGDIIRGVTELEMERRIEADLLGRFRLI